MNRDGDKPTVPAPPTRIDGAKIDESSVVKTCEHDYVVLYTDYEQEEGGYEAGYKIIYRRKDFFYCRKCLDQRSIVSREDKLPNVYKAPEWFGREVIRGR